MSKKHIRIVLIALGALAVILSLGADAVGIGNGLGFGWKQSLGTAAGVMLLAVGAWYGRRGRA
jgi:hypothetical protein